MLIQDVKVERLDNCVKLTIGDDVIGTLKVSFVVSRTAGSVMVTDPAGGMILETVTYSPRNKVTEEYSDGSIWCG